VPLHHPSAGELHQHRGHGTAVEKLVQDAIRRPYGILGERKTGDAFDDTMNAAAGVFILTPASPFYVLLPGLAAA
jgi:hypothetical protein